MQRRQENLQKLINNEPNESNFNQLEILFSAEFKVNPPCFLQTYYRAFQIKKTNRRRVELGWRSYHHLIDHSTMKCLIQLHELIVQILE